MPLPGGATDKFGNRYEGLWTVDSIIDVMDEVANSIRLEPPGEEGDGVEFWLTRSNHREYHQVKRQNTEGRWTLRDLGNKKILSNFSRKLNDEQNANCYFISMNNAYQLEELADRARRSQSWQEFQREFIKARQSKESFFKLCQYWSSYSDKEIEEVINSNINLNGTLNTSQQQVYGVAIRTYERLKRVCVITISENELRKKLESRLRALVERKTDDLSLNEVVTVVDVLAQYALNQVHHELTALDIWNYLDERGYQRREWGKNNHVLSAIEKANQLYLTSLKQSIVIAEHLLPREEVQIALEVLKNTANRKSVLLVGEAGIGKSGVIFQIVQELKEQGIPLLAFRIDTLNPVVHPKGIGQQLQLPDSPAIVLSSIAKSHKRNCILIIDQLDAVSQVSGRNPQFFDCITCIIEQVSQFSNLRLLLACRKFDLENDRRIKKLTDKRDLVEVVEIHRLSEAIVRNTIQNLGLNSAKLNSKQLELLSLPLHLSLLAEIVKDTKTETLNFKNANDLYQIYWEDKQRKLKERIERPVQWIQVIKKICDSMNQRQSLSVPNLILDEYFLDTDAMISENVLIREGNSIRFFHESFFDYAFARNFASDEKDLLSFLQEDEQHLFRRAQVRQILLHEREDNFEKYLNDLQEILISKDIRFHIKQVTLALLSTLSNPTQKEWQIIEPFVQLQHPDNSLNRHAWSIIRSSFDYSYGSWFQLLDSLGEIERWLREESNIPIKEVISLLWVVQRHFPGRVAELLEPLINKSDTWNEQLQNFIEKIVELHTNRQFFEFFIRLIDEGILDTAKDPYQSNSQLWDLLYSLPEHRPDWTCEAIAHYLNRLLLLYLVRIFSLYSTFINCILINKFWFTKLCDLNIDINPFIKYLYSSRNDLGTIHDTQYTEIFTKSSEKASSSFVHFVFPFITSVLELTVDRNSKVPLQDSVWRYRSYGQVYGIDQILLRSMETALSNIALNYPKEFSEFVTQNLRSSQYETLQCLLIRAYTANGERFADEAIEYLCEQPERLRTGYAICSGNANAALYWGTHQLLKSITLYCSDEYLAKLENLILNYYPDYEKSVRGRVLRGYAQLVLLEAIDDSRRSNEANRRLQEWRRKFTDERLVEKPEKIESPRSIEAYLIDSPIPTKATGKMTDEQWLQAINQYDDEDAGTRFERTGKLAGAGRQLADELEKQVKKDSKRFAKLVCQFPNDSNPSYFNAVLRGMAESSVEIDVQIAFRVCLRCHQLPQKPCGRSISWLFQKLAHLSWPPKALDLISHYALYDSNPEEELWRTKTTNGDIYYGGDILTAGINSTRGSAVEAIAKLIFTDKNRTAYLIGVLEQIVRDPIVAVKACVAEVLTAVLNYDRNLAVRLFEQLVQTEEILLETSRVDLFLYYALRTHFLKLQPILEVMVESKLPKVQKNGAMRVVVTSLSNTNAQSLAQKCLLGTKEHRKATALVYASNLHLADFKEFCENALIQLFNDPDDEVRSEAARCFWEIKGDKLSNYVNLIERFIESPAFKVHHDPIIQSLSKQEVQLPQQTVYRLCERSINIIASNTNNDFFFDAEDISKILIQIYSQSRESSFHSQCLDLIDKMIQLRVYGLDRAIEPYER